MVVPEAREGFDEGRARERGDPKPATQEVAAMAASGLRCRSLGPSQLLKK